MKKFHEGQEVVCIDKICEPSRPELAGLPRVYYNQLYTIRHYERFKDGVWWVSLFERSSDILYSEDGFEAIGEIKEVIEQLNEVIYEHS